MISIMVANKFVNKKNVLITLSALLMCLGSNNAHSQPKGAREARPEGTESATKKKTTDAEGKPVETFKGEIKTRATEITPTQILGKEATHSAPEVKVNKNTTRPTIESTLGEAPATKLSAEQIIEQAPLSKRLDPDVVAEAKKAMIEFGNSLANPEKGGIEANDPALIGLGKIKEYTAEFLSEKKDFSKDGANEALSKAVDKFVREKAYTDSSGRIVNREAAIQALAKKESISIEEATRKIDEQIEAEKKQLCRCAGCRV
jgi:hypothetical protein